MTTGSGRKKSILVIVEGRKREPALIESMFSKFGIAERRRIVPFETVIYQLFSYLDEYGNVEDLDLVDVLRDLNQDNAEKLRLLDGRFTDVILVFDFDPQDNRFDADSLKRYAAAFCDSTDRGLLFINYPSVEAYRDFDHLGDMDFLDSRIDVDGAESDAVAFGYKRLVAERKNKFDDIARINALQWTGIIAMHVSKAQYLLEGTASEDCVFWSGSDDLAGAALDVDLSALLALETRALDRGVVYPLCTCVFFICNWASSVNGSWKKTTRVMD